jgi:hypothetical protein
VEKEFFKKAFSKMNNPYSMFDVSAAFGTESLYSTKSVYVPTYSLTEEEEEKESPICVKYLVRSLYDSDNPLTEKLRASFKAVSGNGILNYEEARLLYKYALCGLFAEEVLSIVADVSVLKRVEVLSEPIVLRTIASLENIVEGKASSNDLTEIASLSLTLIPLINTSAEVSDDVETICSSEQELIKYVKSLGLKNSTLVSLKKITPAVGLSLVKK